MIIADIFTSLSKKITASIAYIKKKQYLCTVFLSTLNKRTYFII